MSLEFAHYGAGDVLVCTDPAPHLTKGKTYVVAWNNRPDINYPSVVNDIGRATMYAGYRFERLDGEAAPCFYDLMEVVRGDMEDMPGFRE